MIKFKQMSEVTLSDTNQIVLPGEVLEALHLKPGDKLHFVVRGDQVVILEKPKSFSASLEGIGRGLYPPDYLKKEHASWD